MVTKNSRPGDPAIEQKQKVLVLCGGKSAEREVSLVSAKTVFDNLDRSRYDALAAFLDADGRWLEIDPALLPSKVGINADRIAKTGRRLERPPEGSVIFPVVHGSLGEDGCLQGALEVWGLPYVGCGVLGSSVGMDKEFTKILAARAGLPQLPYAAVRSEKEAAGLIRKLGLPLFVKPARLGSSVGVSKVKRAADLGPALKTAFAYDDKVIVEKGINAREVECAILGDPWAAPSDPLALKVSIFGEIAPNAEFYTYESKYLDPNGARLIVPAPIPKALAKRMSAMALSAFRALDGYGLARVDFLLDRKTGKPYFNEANTLPGFTSGSMYPMLWRHSGLSTPVLLDRLIALALRRHDSRSRLKAVP